MIRELNNDKFHQSIRITRDIPVKKNPGLSIHAFSVERLAVLLVIQLIDPFIDCIYNFIFHLISIDIESNLI